MYTYVQCVQVYSHDILRYTGEGKPPRIVMLFTPDSDNTTPPDLKMITSFSGMKKTKLLRVAEILVVFTILIKQYSFL